MHSKEIHPLTTWPKVLQRFPVSSGSSLLQSPGKEYPFILSFISSFIQEMTHGVYGMCQPLCLEYILMKTHREVPALGEFTFWRSWQIMNKQKRNNHRLRQCYEEHDWGNMTELGWVEVRGGIYSYSLGCHPDFSGEASLDLTAEGGQAAMGTIGSTLLWGAGGLGQACSALTGQEPLFLEAPHTLWSVFSFAKRAMCSSRSLWSGNPNNYESVNWRIITCMWKYFANCKEFSSITSIWSS